MARPPRRSSAGRAPSLTGRGRAWASAGALLLVLGAVVGSWRAAALGVMTLAALGSLYMAFFPTSVLIWRRHLELLWGVRSDESGGSVAGRPLRLTVTLRNRAPRRLGRARLRIFASSALAPPDGLELEVPAASEATVSSEVLPLKVGWWFLHGAAVELRDALGLCTVEAYFPSPLSIKVLPRPSRALAPASQRPSLGAPHERLGLHALRLRGMGGDLRELREHAPGDPFKQIAWKATARTGKLMVRELDRETMVTHFLLVDIAGSMRQGRPGLTRLDLAVEVAAAYARAVLDAGDRVGLITFDGRIIGEVKPNDGPAHRLRIVERLMDAMSVVDADLTELTDSELVAVVARYLLLQEGLDARLRRTPPIDDPAWARLAVAPTGELYDLQLVDKAVTAVLARRRVGSGPLLAGGELMRLRRFCRVRGIELPYRRMSEAGRRARGLGAALELAAAGRGTQRILVLSDLDQLEGDLTPVERSVRLVRRRGHHLLVALPQPRLQLDEEDATALKMAEIFGWHERRRELADARRLAALGVRVVPLGAESSATLLARFAQPRAVRFAS